MNTDISELSGREKILYCYTCKNESGIYPQARWACPVCGSKVVEKVSSSLGVPFLNA